jgi:Spy/CpxP family protein refolding chaperone
MKMKRTMMFMAVAMLLTCGMATAQNVQNARKGGFRGHGMDPEQMTERMVKEYTLNDSQKSKLLEANKTFVAEMQKARPTEKPQPGERPKMSQEQRQSMQKARKEYDAQLKGILTSEQYEKYQSEQQARRERGMQRGGAKARR